ESGPCEATSDSDAAPQNDIPKGNIEDDGNRIQLGWIEWLAIAGHERASTPNPIRDRKPIIRPSLDASGMRHGGECDRCPEKQPDGRSKEESMKEEPGREAPLDPVNRFTHFGQSSSHWLSRSR